MNRLARRRDANLLPRGLDSSSQLHQFILSCCMLFTIHCGHRPPQIRREGPTINPVLFERDDPSDLVDVTVARRHSSEREREGAKIRKAKYLTQLFTKWSIFVCNCEAVTCYLFYNGRVARGPDPTKKITHVPETFRAEQSRGTICFASPCITLLPNPPIPTKPRFSRETTQFKTIKTPKRKLEMKPNSADQLDSTKKKPSRFRYQKDSNSLHFPPMRHVFH